MVRPNDSFGGAEVAGNSMKMTVGWGDSDSGTNASGFGGLPGGNRGALGEFNGGDLYGDWWTTDLTASTAWLKTCIEIGHQLIGMQPQHCEEVFLSAASKTLNDEPLFDSSLAASS